MGHTVIFTDGEDLNSILSIHQAERWGARQGRARRRHVCAGEADDGQALTEVDLLRSKHRHGQRQEAGGVRDAERGWE